MTTTTPLSGCQNADAVLAVKYRPGEGTSIRPHVCDTSQCHAMFPIASKPGTRLRLFTRGRVKGGDVTVAQEDAGRARLLPVLVATVSRRGFRVAGFELSNTRSAL